MDNDYKPKGCILSAVATYQMRTGQPNIPNRDSGKMGKLMGE